MPGKTAVAKGRAPPSPHKARATCPSHLRKPHPSHRDLGTFPSLGALPDSLPSWFQMMSFPQSPFPARSPLDVSGTIGGLSLTSPSGQLIPVKNLSENIEVDLGCSQKSGAFLSSSPTWLEPKVDPLWKKEEIYRKGKEREKGMEGFS